MTATDTEVDLSLWFDMLPPCEYGGHTELRHSGEAAWEIRILCPGCDDINYILICEECKAVCQQGIMYCEECKLIGDYKLFWTRMRKL